MAQKSTLPRNRGQSGAIKRARLSDKRKTRGKRGGRREGAGRPVSPIYRTMKDVREWAMRSGMLPHVFLLRVCRGEEIDGYKPNFSERMEAAKSCANYFVPRFSTIQHVDEHPPTPDGLFRFDDAALEKLSLDELEILEKVFHKLEGTEPSSSRADSSAYAQSRNDADPSDYAATLGDEDDEDD